ncbi:response regulator [Aliiglaciecola sp.]|nr:response regulator [Aliiglaciecola sp.]
MNNVAKNDAPPVVLAVDDEANILRSIRRTLHGLDIELLLTDAPEKAIRILESRVVDVVISDMKMPNINGADVLKKAAELQPSAFRIILSGYAEIDMMLAAINDGKVHRYLNKPWNNEALSEVINEGIEITSLRKENARLLKLTQVQNAKLANMNQELEQKVTLRTRQIKAAFKAARQHSISLERVLYNVIVSHPKIDGGFARQVSESVRQLAVNLKLSAKEIYAARLAGLICEIGQISLPQDILERPFSELNYQQQRVFISQVDQAKLILSPLLTLENEIELIAKQFEPVNDEPRPPTGANLIAICRDYWRYRHGRILPTKLSSKDARKEMLKHAGVKYDRRFLSTFIEMDIQTLSKAEDVMRTPRDLKPGMRLNNDLYNESHILLLPQGHIFTEASIAKLRQFESGYEGQLLVDVGETANRTEDEG